MLFVLVVLSHDRRRILSAYAAYYNGVSTHLTLSKDAPDHRAIQTASRGIVKELEHVGGLHHEYVRMAA